MAVVRIAGVTLPDNKHIVIALTYIKGIGRTKSRQILKEANIDEVTQSKALSEEEIGRIRAVIEKKNLVLEGDLARAVHSNIKRLKEIGSWRGSRHIRHLPVRGQRTKTNSRTVRGNVRKTATSGKKPTAQKT
ncbi:30S ribosomal protein S13 [bacterium CG10_46_32]|nr:MAG: 30S ribosomal protein S13 [bacterium CG10_46_32]PIR55922.1 MAG: 30S ribosomal protein S13 [Parcubacteria group bacterium CG10_big_fil_rev_8_21_14_0_10_46_32]